MEDIRNVKKLDLTLIVHKPNQLVDFLAKITEMGIREEIKIGQVILAKAFQVDKEFIQIMNAFRISRLTLGDFSIA